MRYLGFDAKQRYTPNRLTVKAACGDEVRVQLSDFPRALMVSDKLVDSGSDDLILHYKLIPRKPAVRSTCVTPLDVYASITRSSGPRVGRYQRHPWARPMAPRWGAWSH